MAPGVASYGVGVADDEDWWTIADAAKECGISPSTWQSYVSRGQAPPPDRTFARTPVWRPSTVREWHAKRPGKGWRGQRTESPADTPDRGSTAS